MRRVPPGRGHDRQPVLWLPDAGVKGILDVLEREPVPFERGAKVLFAGSNDQIHIVDALGQVGA